MFDIKKGLYFWAKILKILFEIIENVGRFFISFIELFKKKQKWPEVRLSTLNYQMFRFDDKNV